MADVENTGNSLNVENNNGDITNVYGTSPKLSSANLYNQQSSVGNGLTGPEPKINQTATEDIFNNIILSARSSSDQYAYAKPTSFNSTHTGLNFDRYYNHDQFKKLGFSPYRDNETIYNANSSWSDDFGRAFNMYGTLWGNGFSSLFKNWGSLASSTPDFEGAHTMEKAMAIGSSSKDGFGASFTNFFLNSAYTVGVLSEIAAEELAIMAAASLAPPTAAAGIPRTALNIGRFGKAIGAMFRNAKNVSNARKIWNVAKKITPFGDTLDLARGLAMGDRATLRGVRQSQNSLDAFARSKALFGQFYRDTREINAASAESKLEAGMVSNQVSADLINKFYAENGRMPNDTESKIIYDRAQRSGAQAFLYNMPAIYFSNKIVLETAFKGIKPLRNILSNVPGRLRPIIKIGKDGKKVSKILDLDAAKTYFTKDYWRNIGRGMGPKKILGSGLRYTSANIMEGAQEIYQESLSAGLIDHYTKQNWSSERIGQADLLNSLSIGYDELDRNDMALETFLSGFLMAAPVGGIQTLAFKKAPKLAQRIAKPKEYEAQQKSRQESIKKLENALTDLVNDPTKWANDFHANATRQNQLALDNAAAEEVGDVKAGKDAQEESMFTHMYTMLQHNMMGEFRDQMKDLLKLNDQELQEAFGGNQSINNADAYNSDLRSRINKAITSSEKLEERYKKANDTFINPFNQKDPNEFHDYNGFEAAKQLYVFNEHMFEQTVDRAQSIFDNLSANEKVSQLVAGNVSSILDTRAGGQLDQLIDQLKQEIKTYEAGTEQDVKLAEEKKKQLEGLEEWKNAATAYEQAYDSMTMAGLDPEQAARYVEEAKRFPKGSTVEYTNKQGKKTQGKVIAKSGDNVILEIINKAGNKQRVAIKVEKAAVVGQIALDFDAQDLEGQDMVDSLEYLFQALFGKMEGMDTKGIEGPEGYLKILAGAGGLNMTREEMSVIFNNIMDYFRLKKDSMNHLNAINRLADPGFFANSAERLSEASKATKRIAELKIKAMLADFEKIQDRHILLQELFELGVFLDPEDVDAFIDDKKVPSRFYTATEVDGIPALTPIDPRIEKHQALYKKIIDVLEAYETKEGIQFTNKIDISIIQQVQAGQLGQLFRKTREDSRTLKDLAEEYKFNTEEDSEIDVKELLQKIIDSDFGRAHDKILARKLLATIPETFTVKFSRNHGVGVSYDSVNGVVINPNFSSENYQGGQVALESLLLNGIMQKLVADNLSNEQFKTAIEKIKDQVAEALANGQLDEIIDELKNKYEIDFTNIIGKVAVDNIAGMRSLEQFVAMAMTDPAFQSLLANVTVEETQKTIWEEFLEAIKILVRQLTEIAPGTTALDEVVALTTAALTGSDIITTTEETPVKTKPTVTTLLNSMPEELRKALQTAWGALSEEEKKGYTDISEWVKGSSAAASIISKYNKKQEQKEDDEKTQEELIIAALTPQQLSYLRNKSGLNDQDIFAMDVNDLVEIADGKFRILNEGEVLTQSQKDQGKVIKTFNNIKMTNAQEVNPALLEDPVIAEKLNQIGRTLEGILSNALGRDSNEKKVDLLKNAPRALAEKIIDQIKAIYNIKDLEFTEEMGSKIRLLLSDNDTFFFRVTSLRDIVENMRASSKENIPQQLSEAIETLLKEGPGTDPMKMGADRGLFMDEFFRIALLTGLNSVIDKTYIDRLINQAIENIQNTSGFNISETVKLTEDAKQQLRETLQHTVTYMKENNLRVLPNTNELFGSIGVLPVSGQVDLIMYNDKGEIFILDMKTMPTQRDRAQMEGYGREVTGKTTTDSLGYASKDTAQLNIYRELIQALVGAQLEQEGMQIKGLGIIPLLVGARLNNSNELTVRSIKISDPIREDSDGTRGLYIPVLEKTTVELFPELYAQQAPPSTPSGTTGIKNWANDLSTIKNELGKLQNKEEKLQWLADNNYLEPFTVNNKTSNYLKTAAGRVVVKIKIGNTTIPFYISTGAGGKADVQVDKWYVFFGQGKDGWFNKTSGKDMNKQYDVKIFQDIADVLNEIGSKKEEYKNHEDAKGFMDLRWTGAAEEQLKTVIDFITPVQPNPGPNGPVATPEQIKQLKENIQLVKDRVAKELATLEEKITPKKVKGSSGWKVRFNVNAITDEDYKAKVEKLSQWLDEYFGTTKRSKQTGDGFFAFKEGNSDSVWKHLAGGDKGEADFTIYIGSKKDAIEFAKQVEESEIKDLIEVGTMGNDVLIGNTIKGRFDSKEFKYLAPIVPILKKSLEDEGLSKNGEYVTQTKSGIAIVITDGVIVYSTDGKKTFKDYRSNIMSDAKTITEVRDQIIEDIYGKDYTGNDVEASTSSIINQETLDTFAGQVIYVSPAITISEELANDPNVILYDDISIEILNQHLDELGVAEITRETLFATISEIYSSTNENAKKKLTQLLDNDIYIAAINELAENPEKILITQSTIFTKEASNNVAVAIVPEDLKSYDSKKTIAFEQVAFRKNSRLLVAKSNDLQEILKDSLSKLDGQRDETSTVGFATYDDFIKEADFESLMLLLTEIDTMEEDMELGFKNQEEAEKQEGGEKVYLRNLITDELKSRMKDGITNSRELLKIAKEGDIVIMSDTKVYPQGLGVVTAQGQIKAVYYTESTAKNDPNFLIYGYAVTPANTVIGVEQLAEILEEDATTKDENMQAAENNKTANETISKENKVAAVNDATSAAKEADNIDFCD